MLVIRDSFGDALKPFLNETFSDTLYILDSWHYRVNRHIVAEFKPDIVIFVTMESFLDSMLDHREIIDSE